jgi:hypothetical protein
MLMLVGWKLTTLDDKENSSALVNVEPSILDVLESRGGIQQSG